MGYVFQPLVCVIARGLKPSFQAVNIICYVSLAIWNIPEGWRWACYILSGAGYGLSGLCMAYVRPFLPSPLMPIANDSSSWAHEICAGDNEERAIVVASMNEMAYVLQAWLPLLVWQQIDAPQYRKGFITVTALSAALIGTGFVTKALHKSQIRRFDPDLWRLNVTRLKGPRSLGRATSHRPKTRPPGHLTRT